MYIFPSWLNASKEYNGHIDSSYCTGEIRHLWLMTCSLFHQSRSHMELEERDYFLIHCYKNETHWNHGVTDFRQDLVILSRLLIRSQLLLVDKSCDAYNSEHFILWGLPYFLLLKAKKTILSLVDICDIIMYLSLFLQI